MNDVDTLTLKTLNPRVVRAEYAVRGAIAIRAEQLSAQLAAKSGSTKLPFDAIVSCNIGNPQQLGQKPITFFRQVRFMELHVFHLFER